MVLGGKLIDQPERAKTPCAAYQRRKIIRFEHKLTVLSRYSGDLGT